MKSKDIDLPLRDKYIDPLHYLNIVRNAPIIWHPTTPRNFRCEEGCRCCCGPTYFFPSESQALPPDIANRLTPEPTRGIIKLCRDEVHGGCLFMENSFKGYSCLIHDVSPLRCKIYPFLPIIVKNNIIIMAEPYCDVFHEGKRGPDPLDICYGLGTGPDVSKEVETMAKDFLTREITENPGFLILSVYNNPEDILNNEFIRIHTHRKFQTHSEAFPHIMSKVKEKLARKKK